MIANHAQFLAAIQEKKLVRLVFYSLPDGGTVDRECAPLDYGPESGSEDARNRYWVWDPANTAGTNPKGLLPDQIVSMRALGVAFEPAELGVPMRTWSVPREWGTPSPPASPPADAPAPRS